MASRKLSYPITRDYPWRYFTPAALMFSILVLAVLTVINAAAVGYDAVSVVRDNFNASQTYWWSSFLHPPKPTCDARQFNYGDIFFTNVSIFDYTIAIIDGSNGFLYSGAPLSEICSVGYYGVIVDKTQSTVQGGAALECYGHNNTTIKIQSSYVTRTPVGFWKQSATVGRDVLDSFAYDLLVGALAELTTGATTIDILQAGAVTCEGLANNFTDTSITPAQATACANVPGPLNIANVALSYSNGSVNWILLDPPADHIAGLPATLAESVPNYLRALHAVILMDIGNWDNNSILASPAMFNASITSNTAISMVKQNNPSFFPPDWGSVSSASLLRADPSTFMVPVTSRNPAIIAISYLCHDQRRKSVLSFFISVIVADASMFAAFWAIFMAVASYFASKEDNDIQKHREEQPYARMI